MTATTPPRTLREILEQSTAVIGLDENADGRQLEKAAKLLCPTCNAGIPQTSGFHWPDTRAIECLAAMPSEKLSDEELGCLEQAVALSIARTDTVKNIDIAPGEIICTATELAAIIAELRELRAYQRIERLERITDRIAYEDDKDADHGK